MRRSVPQRMALVSERLHRNKTLNPPPKPLASLRIMSQTTTFVKGSYGAVPGLLAVGSPALRNPVEFYEGSRWIGIGHLSANGTLARLVLKNIPPGKHTYTAQYPADRYYSKHDLGLVTVEAGDNCPAGCSDTAN
jgi:hypothetical protein